MSTQRLASHKPLSLESSQRITSRRDRQYNCCSNQAGRIQHERHPLYDCHDKVDCGAHVVCFKATDKLVEFLGGWANAEEERHFQEENDEGADSVVEDLRLALVVEDIRRLPDRGDRVKLVKQRQVETYKQMILKITTRPKWKMFAMPSAKQRIMQSMPIHCP